MQIKNISPFEGKTDVELNTTVSFVLEGVEDEVKIEFFLDGVKISEQRRKGGHVALDVKGLYEDTEYTWYVIIDDGTLVSEEASFSTRVMIEGNYYRRLYNKLFQAMIEGDAELLLLKETKRRRELEQSYNDLGSLQRFLQWLKEEADKVDSGYNGGIIYSIGGSNEV